MLSLLGNLRLKWSIILYTFSAVNNAIGEQKSAVEKVYIIETDDEFLYFFRKSSGNGQHTQQVFIVGYLFIKSNIPLP